MQSASYFSSCIETLDNLSLFIDNMCLRINLKTDHSMVNDWFSRSGIKWWLFNLEVKSSFFKFRIIARININIISCDRLDKDLWLHLSLLSQLFQTIWSVNHSMCYLCINLFLTSCFFDIFICNQIEKTTIVNCCLNSFIPTTVLIYKTFSLSIDHDEVSRRRL